MQRSSMWQNSPLLKLKYGLLILVGIGTLAFSADKLVSGTNTDRQVDALKPIPTFAIQPELWPLIPVNSLDVGHIQAKALVLIDEESGEILAERNSQIRLPMASTTKIMTAALVLEFTKPESIVTIPVQALVDLPPDSAIMGITPNEQYTIEELLYGLMLNSGNDAANALALAVSGSISDFVALMNAKAEQLGLRNTHFMNSTGLDDPEHYSTAQDLAIIAHYARSFPLFNEIVVVPTMQLPYSRMHKELYLENLNPMVSTYPGATGIKPGNTGEAGNCLVASASRNNKHLIGVLLNTPGRNTNMASLFDLGFSGE